MGVAFVLTCYLTLTGCTQAPPQSKPIQRSTPRVETGADSELVGSKSTRIYLLMEASGYLKFPLALQATEEAQLDLAYKRQLIQHFTISQAQLRPIFQSANTSSQPIDRTTPLFYTYESVVRQNDERFQRLVKDPQFQEFDRRMKIIQSQVDLLMSQPLAFERGFRTLGVEPAQAPKLDLVLHNADAAIDVFRSTPVTAPDTVKLFEKRIDDALETRDALRDIFTPAQNTMWDALAIPTRPTHR